MTAPDVGFRTQGPSHPFTRTDAPIRAEGMTRRDDDTNTTRVQVTTPEFAALLAVLANAGIVTRTTRQTPSSSPTVSLLDRVIDGALATDGKPLAADGANAAATTSRTGTENNAAAPLLSPQPSVLSGTHDATDKLRYGMVTERVTDDANAAPISGPTVQGRNRVSPRMPDETDAILTPRGEARPATADEQLAIAEAKRAATRAALDVLLMQSRALDSNGADTSSLTQSRDGLFAGGASGVSRLSDARNSASRAAVDSLLASSRVSPRTSSRSSSQSSDDTSRTVARTRRNSEGDDFLSMRDGTAGEARATLDALLAHAGTSLGAQMAAAASTRGAGDVAAPVHDPATLAPEFRARLERVVERMQSEFGHDVQLVETVRSQDRQDFLFAQGRTRSGEVVTWTRDSAHTRGEAADVIVDGSWNNPEGFTRLHRIAREEGLRTLGARDPGHLELPNVTRAEAASTVAQTSAPGTSPASSTTAARAAGIASVASVASVAGVAAQRDAAEVAPAPASTSVSNTALRARSDTTANDSTARDEHPSARRAPAERRDDARALATGTPITTSASANITNSPTVERTPAAAGAATADRVADLHQMRDDAPAIAMSRMSLDVEGVDGLPQRITVDLRGNVVDTHITTDAASADGMRLRTGELQEALERRGLESDTVRISATGRSAADTERLASERADLRMVATPASTSGDSAAQHGPRDRSANAREWERQDDARRARDEQRQSSGQRGRRSTHNQDAS